MSVGVLFILNVIDDKIISLHYGVKVDDKFHLRNLILKSS